MPVLGMAERIAHNGVYGKSGQDHTACQCEPRTGMRPTVNVGLDTQTSAK